MSVKAISWALEDVKGVHPTQKLVLVALANEAASDGQAAFISAPTIAELTGIGERQVRRHLKDMEAMGLIVRGDQRRAAYIPLNYRPTVYNLNLDSRGRLSAIMNPRPKRPHAGTKNLLTQSPGVTPTAPLTPETRVTHDTPRGDTQGNPGVTLGVSPSTGNPLTQEITPVRRTECKGCNRHYEPDQVTSTGHCKDCLLRGPDPEPAAIGPGLAAVREMLATRRQGPAGGAPFDTETLKEA